MLNPRLANSLDELVLVRKNFPDVVFYHFPCADGFTARWVMQSFFDRLCADFRSDVHPEEFDDIVFVPYNYEKTLPTYAGLHVLFVDCSPATDELTRTLLTECASVTVIDHHKTAFERLSDLEQVQVHSVYECQPWNKRRGLYCVLNNTASGAKLTFKYFLESYYYSLYLLNVEKSAYQLLTTVEVLKELHHSQSMLVNYVSDRDTWAFKEYKSKLVNEYLLAIPYDMEEYNLAADRLVNDFDTVVAIGTVLAQKRLKDTTELLKFVAFTETVVSGNTTYLITFANMPYMMVSDAADIVCTTENHLFVAFYIDKNDEYVISLRSRGTKIDVSKLAAKYGGGGHFNAAGCRSALYPPSMTWL